MTERPIIMQAESVLAILDGRKTQTRRVIRPQPKIIESSRRWYWEKALDCHGQPLVDASRQWWEYYGTSPYGKPGDLLWVRETWFERCDPLTSKPYDPPQYCYRATETEEVFLDDGDGAITWNADGTMASPWCASIHMPKTAARLWLRLTDVRVERVQDISDEDCEAEGWGGAPKGGNPPWATEEPRDEFAAVWDSINGKHGYGWDANPWVWVLTFVKAPHGAREAT